MFSATLQPTMRQEKASPMKQPYAIPARVGPLGEIGTPSVGPVRLEHPVHPVGNPGRVKILAPQCSRDGPALRLPASSHGGPAAPRPRGT